MYSQLPQTHREGARKAERTSHLHVLTTEAFFCRAEAAAAAASALVWEPAGAMATVGAMAEFNGGGVVIVAEEGDMGDDAMLDW